MRPKPLPLPAPTADGKYELIVVSPRSYFL